jgi:cytochrome c biogenesis protein
VGANHKPYGLGNIEWLSSMKFAINLLIVVGVVMSLGTLIPQGQAPAFYRDTYGDMLGSIITAFALDNMYQAGWFYVLIALLGGTIIFCAYQRLGKTRSLPGIGSLVFHVAIVLTLVGAAWSFGYARSAAVEIGAGQTVSMADSQFLHHRLLPRLCSPSIHQQFESARV